MWKFEFILIFNLLEFKFELWQQQKPKTKKFGIGIWVLVTGWINKTDKIKHLKS